MGEPRCTILSSYAARESTPAKLLEHVLLPSPTHPPCHPPSLEDLMPIMLIVLWTGLPACVSTPCRPLLELSCSTPSSSAARESTPAKLLEHALPPFPILPPFHPPSPEDLMPIMPIVPGTGLQACVSTPCRPLLELSCTTPSSSAARESTPAKL